MPPVLRGYNKVLPSAPLWRRLVRRPATHIGAQLCQNAIYYNGNTYIGFNDASAAIGTSYAGQGAIKVAKVNHATGAVTISPTIIGSIQPDQHLTPTVLIRSSDKKILIASSGFDDTHLYTALSTNAEDISAWGASSDIGSTVAQSPYQFGSLFQLSNEFGKIYLFFQKGSPGVQLGLWYITSTDGGSTWSAATKVFEVTNKSCYYSVNSDDIGRIDVAIDDGSFVSGDGSGSLYHFYYSGGTWRTSSGASMGSPPFNAASGTKVIDGPTYGNIRTPYSISKDGTVIVWSAGATSNQLTTPANYWYAVYTGGAWVTNQIVSETLYPFGSYWEGGITIDPTDNTKVYLCKGGDVFRYSTSNNGSSWSSTQITFDAAGGPNFRVAGVRNADPALKVIFTYGQMTYDAQAMEIRGYPA